MVHLHVWAQCPLLPPSGWQLVSVCVTEVPRGQVTRWLAVGCLELREAANLVMAATYWTKDTVVMIRYMQGVKLYGCG